MLNFVFLPMPMYVCVQRIVIYMILHIYIYIYKSITQIKYVQTMIVKRSLEGALSSHGQMSTVMARSWEQIRSGHSYREESAGQAVLDVTMKEDFARKAMFCRA